MHSDHGATCLVKVLSLGGPHPLAGLKRFHNPRLSNLFPPTSPYDHKEVLGRTQNFGQQSKKEHRPRNLPASRYIFAT